MPNSSENDDTPGWVMGDLPGEERRPTNDQGRQPSDETEHAETGVVAGQEADAADTREHVEPEAVPPDAPASEGEAAVDAVLESSVVEVPPLFLGDAVLPLDEDEPGAVAVVVEAELQADELASEGEAAAAPVVTETEAPVTSEAELVVEAANLVPGVAQEPANGVERPLEGEAAPAPAEADAPQKPRQRGKKAREPKPVAVAAEALEALSQASSAHSGPPVSMGPAVPTGDLSLVARVESLLFVADGAVPVARLAEALEIHPREVEAALSELAESYRHRGLSLQRFRDRVQLTTAPAAAALVERFLGLAASTPLSRAALEALAIVAYQQPVTRPQIEAVRGVNSDSVIKNLLTKGLIEESGRAEGPGRPVLYSTTTEFMQHFGLASLTDLPPLTLPSADPAAEANTAESILKG